MSQITTPANESAWTRQPEEAPTHDTSCIQDIADYVEQVMADHSFSYERVTGNHEFVPVGRAYIRAFCEGEGFPWNSVASELRRRQFRRSSARTAATPDRETNHGIVVRANTFAELTYGLTPLCPYYKRSISRADFVFRKTKKPCGSWACEVCGPELAEALFAYLRDLLTGQSALHIADVKYRDGLMSMMWHRRDTAQSEVFWYRDVADVVTYISTKPMPGYKEPRVWRPVSPQEAMALLRKVLWVPGHWDHDFSPKWKPDEGSEVGVSGLGTFDVSDISDSQVHQALAIFKEEAKRSFDVDVADFIPPECRSALEDLMEDVLAQVRAGSIPS
jgi:hypothetical protein